MRTKNVEPAGCSTGVPTSSATVSARQQYDKQTAIKMLQHYLGSKSLSALTSSPAMDTILLISNRLEKFAAGRALYNLSLAAASLQNAPKVQASALLVAGSFSDHALLNITDSLYWMTKDGAGPLGAQRFTRLFGSQIAHTAIDSANELALPSIITWLSFAAASKDDQRFLSMALMLSSKNVATAINCSPEFAVSHIADLVCESAYKRPHGAVFAIHLARAINASGVSSRLNPLSNNEETLQSEIDSVVSAAASSVERKILRAITPALGLPLLENAFLRAYGLVPSSFGAHIILGHGASDLLRR